MEEGGNGQGGTSRGVKRDGRGRGNKEQQAVVAGPQPTALLTLSVIDQSSFFPPCPLASSGIQSTAHMPPCSCAQCCTATVVLFSTKYTNKLTGHDSIWRLHRYTHGCCLEIPRDSISPRMHTELAPGEDSRQSRPACMHAFQRVICLPGSGPFPLLTGG